ncbi:glycine cleavage system protein R [Salinarimonas chemoclinalis]|uniref:glycine cleavage system protein R n=1 Tax=Salinarimonas chemoclinalis TaxID=3241599 RepID=UPI003558C394
MSVEMVISVIARDRPGLVKRLSALVAGVGGNWIDSSMARLGGAFAGIVRVSLPEAAAAELEAALDGLAEEGITAQARRTEPGAPLAGQRAVLELTCSDHPGIVRDIADRLAARKVSIDELETEVFAGSMSGDALFSAKARIVLPEDVSAQDVREDLEAIGLDIMAEIVLRETD